MATLHARSPVVARPLPARAGATCGITRARRGLSLCASADQASRRQAVFGAFLASGAALAVTAPARAGLLDGGPSEEEVYKQDTGALIGLVQSSLAVPSDSPDHDDAINKAREEIKQWVAKYRRGGNYTGRPSYGNTYTALNALAGHYNNFGPSSPLPKKRLERLNKELVDAKKLLDRNR